MDEVDVIAFMSVGNKTCLITCSDGTTPTVPEFETMGLLPMEGGVVLFHYQDGKPVGISALNEKMVRKLAGQLNVMIQNFR